MGKFGNSRPPIKYQITPSTHNRRGCLNCGMNEKENTASKSFTTEDEIDILSGHVVEFEGEVERTLAILSEANDKIQVLNFIIIIAFIFKHHIHVFI